MDAKTQTTIIRTLGIIATITLIEIPLIIYTIPTIELAIITALIAIPSSITTGLIGFIAGKTISEKQEEMVLDIYNDQ